MFRDFFLAHLLQICTTIITFDEYQVIDTHLGDERRFLECMLHYMLF